jgi:hypothetical protein
VKGKPELLLLRSHSLVREHRQACIKYTEKKHKREGRLVGGGRRSEPVLTKGPWAWISYNAHFTEKSKSKQTEEYRMITHLILNSGTKWWNFKRLAYSPKKICLHFEFGHDLLSDTCSWVVKIPMQYRTEVRNSLLSVVPDSWRSPSSFKAGNRDARIVNTGSQRIPCRLWDTYIKFRTDWKIQKDTDYQLEHDVPYTSGLNMRVLQCFYIPVEYAICRIYFSSRFVQSEICTFITSPICIFYSTRNLSLVTFDISIIPLFTWNGREFCYSNFLNIFIYF